MTATAPKVTYLGPKTETKKGVSIFGSIEVTNYHYQLEFMGEVILKKFEASIFDQLPMEGKKQILQHEFDTAVAGIKRRKILANRTALPDRDGHVVDSRELYELEMIESGLGVFSSGDTVMFAGRDGSVHRY